jgi:UDP-glucose 4-epimerase
VAGAEKALGERHTEETHIIPLALAAANASSGFTLFGNDYPTPDGTCVRDYIHISDLADAHVLALEKMQPGHHAIYNLGNGQGFSNRDILHMVETVTGHQLSVSEAARRPGDPAVLVASSQKARNELGWQPRHDQLDTIVGDAWLFYRQTYSKVGL